MKSEVETKKQIINNLTIIFIKKLNKLQINSERIMNNDELITLKGGYWYGTCEVMCDYQYINAPAAAGNCFTAELICEGMWSECDCKCC